MARRFASSIQQNATPDVLGSAPWNKNRRIIAGAAGGIHVCEDACRLYVAPGAYSEIRKVVFWASIRHEYTGAETSVPVILRVAPSSSQAASRALETKLFGSSSFTVTNGTGPIWTTTAPSNEAAFYGNTELDLRNQIDLSRRNTLTTGGSQLIYQEFDLFDPSSEDFFTDWNLAAQGGKDAHIAYYVGVQRTNGASWNNSGSTQLNSPVIVDCGVAFIQAPSVNNQTRFLIPCAPALYDPAAMATTYPSLRRAIPFIYRADEWSGELEFRIFTRQVPSAVGTRGRFEVQINRTTNFSQTTTPILVEAFGVGNTTNNNTYLARSQDFFNLLQDGDILTVQFRSTTGALQDAPWAWIEVTATGFNKVTTFFSTGHPVIAAAFLPTGAPPPQVYSKCSTLFDPLWFQDFESNRILSSRIQAGIIHENLNNDAEQLIRINANLAAYEDVSLFNADVQPEFKVSAAGFCIGDDEVLTNNPINLAGKRKMSVYFSSFWDFVTNDVPGSMNLLYVLIVPNTEVVELGPLFDLGSFDAEGCAATSAGLGEPPLLIITNGSTIPQKFNPTASGTSGEVEDAGIPVPFEDEVPQAVPSDAAASPTGGLEIGTYRYRYTFRNCCTGKESDPNPDDIVVDTTGQSPAAQVTFSFAGVRIPGDAQICEICLYRTLEGGDFPVMAKVGCFNIDETTVFVDDLNDDSLDFLNDSISILNGPMPCVPIVVDFRNRLFGMGDIPNLAPAGTVSVVEDSDIVTGSSDVVWDRCLEGRFVKIGNDCRAYEILRVLPPEEGLSPPIARLRLVDNYEGATDTGLSYVLCGRPNRLYFSEPLEPEYWPAANFLDIEPGDGDRLMGAVSNFDRLVICKRRKTYILTFRENPGFEVIVPSRISSDIGCIGPRTFAQIESGSVWLADRGLAIYDGRTVMHVPESEQMNDIFTDEENPNYVRRDRNGRVIEAVGVFYPKREQYLLLLPTVQTSRGCNMMLVWDVKMRNITLLKFCQEFLSMTVGKDSAGNERVYIGDTNGFVWIFDIGDTDGVGYPNATGTVRGDVTFAGVDEETGASVMDDSSASFIEGGIPSFADLSGIPGFSPSLGGGNVGLAGACVYTRRKGASYDEPWIARTIYAATSTRLYVTPQWGPDVPFDADGVVEYEYMIGAIELDLLFKPQNYGTDDMSKRDWRQIVVHEQESFASKLRVDLLPDFALSDPEADTVVDPVTGETGEGRVFRMDYAKGRQIKPVGRLIHWYMAVRMRNFAPEEPIEIINHLLGVEPRVSK